jgi:hypothetical protein
MLRYQIGYYKKSSLFMFLKSKCISIFDNFIVKLLVDRQPNGS